MTKRIVTVEWVDSEGTSVWTHKDRLVEDFQKPQPVIETCGYLWHANKQEVIVYQSHDTKNDVYDHILRIPRFAVRKVTKL